MVIIALVVPAGQEVRLIVKGTHVLDAPAACSDDAWIFCPKSIAFVTLSLLIWQGEAIIFPVIFSVTGSAACASMLKEKQPIARVFK
ncbi:hypothetical protein ABR24_19130 [Enterobacter kobei]|nr:hypothetical protein ABR24_19130 [Enterobacter kobei]